jgi:hypothetical protein
MIVEFNKNEIGFKKSKKPKDVQKNDEKFVEWVIGVLKKANDNKLLADGEKYYAPSIALNKENNNYIHQNMSSWVWLNYSPTEKADLADNEMEINMNKIIEKGSI